MDSPQTIGHGRVSHPVPQRGITMRSQCRTFSFALATSGLLAAAPARSARALDSLPPVRVLVRNDGGTNVVVYAYRGGERVRIGFVIGHGQSVVTVPSGMTIPGHVQLLLHPVTGGADFLADEIPIRPDQEHVELHVTPMLDESSITVVSGPVKS